VTHTSNVIFVRPLSKELRAYDVVLNCEWPAWHSPFPDAKTIVSQLIFLLISYGT